MHLSLNRTYPWVIYLSDRELSVVQAVMRGDDLDEETEAEADRLSNTIDKIRPLAERTRERKERARDRSSHGPRPRQLSAIE